MKMLVPVLSFIAFFAQLYMVPMGRAAINSFFGRLVQQQADTVMALGLFYPVGILLAFFLVALPFDIAILYTGFRSPQEARAIA